MSLDKIRREEELCKSRESKEETLTSLESMKGGYDELLRHERLTKPAN